jgi:hypothetical protein
VLRFCLPSCFGAALFSLSGIATVILGAKLAQCVILPQGKSPKNPLIPGI